jgi:SPP1 gp7 family putative phage head morphogenesis protein
MPTWNQELYDRTVRNLIYLRRYSAGEARRVEKQLAKAEKDLVARLGAKLAPLAGAAYPNTKLAKKRLQVMLKEVRELRAQTWARIREDQTAVLKTLAKDEARREAGSIRDSAPIVFDVVSPPLGRAAAAALAKPFQGQLLSGWFDQLEAGDRRRVESAIVLGITEGEEVGAIVRRLRAELGPLAVARRDAAGIVRTAVNHVSEAAREEVWKANSDIIDGLRWTSVLDGRTSAVCRARDGKVYPVGEGPRPPAHFSCRSVMVAVISGVGAVGTRATVTDTRTGERRQTDFKAEARRTGLPLAEVRSRWAKENVGSVPAEETYDGFLRRQSAAFQNRVLGNAKGKLFRDGGLTADRFVDRAGNELTLDQLRAKEPAAWREAFGE